MHVHVNVCASGRDQDEVPERHRAAVFISLGLRAEDLPQRRDGRLSQGDSDSSAHLVGERHS